MYIYLSQAQKSLQKPTKRKLKTTEKLSGTDGKIRVRLGTKQIFQNNILLAKGFVSKANHIFGFIQHKKVFDMLFSSSSSIFESEVIRCKSVAKSFTICQCSEAVARKIFPNPLSFDIYRSFFYNFCMYCWLNCCFGNSIIIRAKL